VRPCVDLLLAAARDADPGAGVGECFRDAQVDAACAAEDEDVLAAEIE